MAEAVAVGVRDGAIVAEGVGGGGLVAVGAGPQAAMARIARIKTGLKEGMGNNKPRQPAESAGRRGRLLTAV